MEFNKRKKNIEKREKQIKEDKKLKLVFEELNKPSIFNYYDEIKNEFANIELYKNKIIQVHFIGLTKNPPPGLLQANYGIEPPDRIRQDELHPVKSYRSYRPLVNIDKKGVAELYDILGVRDTLFPLTRSCSAYTDDFTYHCGQCWFCAERFYGFKKY